MYIIFWVSIGLFLTFSAYKICKSVKTIHSIKPPVQSLENRLFNPTMDYNNGLSCEVVIKNRKAPTNNSSFEQKIFRG